MSLVIAEQNTLMPLGYAVTLPQLGHFHRSKLKFILPTLRTRKLMSNAKERLLAGTILSAVAIGSVHAAPLDGMFVIAQAPQQGDHEKEKKPQGDHEKEKKPERPSQPPPPQQRQVQPPPVQQQVQPPSQGA